MDRDERIVSEFVAGAEVPDIAARYAVPEAYVDRVIEETHIAQPEKRRWDHSWKNWGNRMAYSMATALVLNLLTGNLTLGAAIGVLLFVVTSAIVSIRR